MSRMPIVVELLTLFIPWEAYKHFRKRRTTTTLKKADNGDHVAASHVTSGARP